MNRLHNSKMNPSEDEYGDQEERAVANTQPEKDGWMMTAGKIAAASAVSFLVWKVLQATIGHRIDRWIDRGT